MMKKILLLFCLFALPHFTFAQCNPFYTLEEGNKWTITNYNGKDKKTGMLQYDVKSLRNVDDGWVAELMFTSYGKKDKMEMQETIEMTCDDGTIKMDMSRFFPKEMMESMQGANMNIETENIEFPEELEVGDMLPDAAVRITGDLPFKMETKISNRKVTAKESVTTPAGTYECYKLEYTVNTKSIMNLETKGADWIAEDVGMVKSEYYNKNGKLNGRSVLTSFEK